MFDAPETSPNCDCHQQACVPQSYDTCHTLFVRDAKTFDKTNHRDTQERVTDQHRVADCQHVQVTTHQSGECKAYDMAGCLE